MVCLPAKRLWLCFALFTLVPLARAEKPSTVILIPASDWRVASTEKVDLNALSQLGGQPAVEHEYGVDSISVRTYETGNRTVKVIVEPSPDASTAYGLLTYYRSDGMNPVEGLQLTWAGPDGALMARGRYFFRVPRAAAAAAISDSEFRSLLSVIGNSHPPVEANGSLPDALPNKGLIPGSEKYIVGEEAARHVLPSFRTDLIGFSQGAEVQTGVYSTANGRATVMTVDYPTPQIALARFGLMEKILALNQDHGAGSIYGKRLGSYVVLVLDSGSPAIANSLMDVFKLSGRVVPDERYPGDKSVAVQMAELIVANIIFVFILSSAAFAGGMVVFLAKRWARKWMPQTQWGQEDGEALIVLKLS